MRKIYYASSNNSKVEMAKSFLESCSDVIIEQAKIDLVEEQILSLESIAISKARQAWNLLGKPVLVDDCGVYFEKYNQFPGAMTKFVYQSLGFDGLYRLYDVGDRVHFTTHVVFANQDGYKVFSDKVSGHLIKPSQLDHDSNIPFAQVVVPDGSDTTWYDAMKRKGFSEYDPRIMALRKFLEFIKKEQVSENRVCKKGLGSCEENSKR